jgi:hypothetical protein
LEPVGVLVLVNENVVEASTDVAGNGRLGHRVTPVQQEVVVIKNIVLLLPGDIGLKEAAELAGPLGAPWKEPGKRFFERTAGIDGVRVDRQAGVRFMRSAAAHCGSTPGRSGSTRPFAVLDRADSADLLDLTRSELGLAQTASRFPRKDDRQHLHSLNPEQRVPDQGRSDDPVETPWAASPRASARISWLRRVISSAARRVKGLAAGAADRGRSG